MAQHEQFVLVDDTTGNNIGSSNPMPVAESGSSALANGAETAVANSAVQVLAANANRKLAIVQNTGSANVRVGVASVAANTGVQLAPGAMLTFSMPLIHTGALYAIREGSTSSTVLAMEAT